MNSLHNFIAKTSYFGKFPCLLFHLQINDDLSNPLSLSVMSDINVTPCKKKKTVDSLNKEMKDIFPIMCQIHGNQHGHQLNSFVLQH